mgnify:FL=1
MCCKTLVPVVPLSRAQRLEGRSSASIVPQLREPHARSSSCPWEDATPPRSQRERTHRLSSSSTSSLQQDSPMPSLRLAPRLLRSSQAPQLWSLLSCAPALSPGKRSLATSAPSHSLIPMVISREVGVPSPVMAWTTEPLAQGQGERAYDIYSRLLKERIIFLNGPVRSLPNAPRTATELPCRSTTTRRPSSLPPCSTARPMPRRTPRSRSTSILQAEA